MTEERKISGAVMRRLPRYYRYLGNLLKNDTRRISSKALAKIMNITASQIRQDLSHFGCFGQQGFGYDVDFLYKEIQKILTLDKLHRMIIIGCGNLGQALANYSGFGGDDFKVLAAFDKNPDYFGKIIGGIEILDVETLPSFITENVIDIAILTVPTANAKKMARILADNGVKAIWNLSNTELDIPDTKGVIVQNTHLTDELMTLCYKLSREVASTNT